jgi:hypothetical protein
MVLGVIMENFTLYFGGGPMNAQATFMGGGEQVDSVIEEDDPALNSKDVVKQNVDEGHGYVGVSFHYSQLFAAMQIDRYTNPFYSAKLGVRF